MNRSPLLRALSRNLAVQDLVILAYLGYIFLRVLVAPNSTAATSSRVAFGLGLAYVVLTLLLTRGELIESPQLRGAVYRFGMFLGIVGSYFYLREALAALQPHLMDTSLIAIDRQLFGAVAGVALASVALILARYITHTESKRPHAGRQPVLESLRRA